MGGLFEVRIGGGNVELLGETQSMKHCMEWKCIRWYLGEIKPAMPCLMGSSRISLQSPSEPFSQFLDAFP